MTRGSRGRRSRGTLDRGREAAIQPEDVVIFQRKEGRAVILAPSGDVDSRVAPVLERIARERLRAKDVLLAIDLSRVEIVTSLGLAVLLRLDKATVAAGGRMVLFQPSTTAREILQKTRLDTVLTVRDDYPEAYRFLTGID